MPAINLYTHVKTIVFACLFSLFCVAGQSGVLAAEPDPAAHIAAIDQAVADADSESFKKMVDLDAILADALNTFVAEASRPENARRLPPMLAMLVAQLSGKSVPAPLKELLLGEARNFVLTGIASGAFAGRKADLSGATGLSAPFFANASLGRKSVVHIGSPRQAGDAWLVPFTVHDEDNGQDYELVGRVVSGANGLLLSGIDNMRQLIYQIGEESAAALGE